MQPKFHAITKTDGSVAIMQIMAQPVVSFIDKDGKVISTSPAGFKRYDDGTFLVSLDGIISPAGTVRGSVDPVYPSADDEIAKWHDDLKAEVISHTEIDPADIPADRTFRDAWTHDGGKIAVDMDKARAIHMSRIRASRDEKLKALDIETMKGRDVQAQKQTLRDIPQTFDLTTAETPDDLKQLWPSELA